MRAHSPRVRGTTDGFWGHEDHSGERPFDEMEEAFFDAPVIDTSESGEIEADARSADGEMEQPGWEGGEEFEAARPGWKAEADVTGDRPGRGSEEVEARRPTSNAVEKAEVERPRWQRPEVDLDRPKWSTPVDVDRPSLARRAPQLPVRPPLRGPGLMSRGALGLIAGLAVGGGIWLAASRLGPLLAGPFDLGRPRGAPTSKVVPGEVPPAVPAATATAVPSSSPQAASAPASAPTPSLAGAPSSSAGLPSSSTPEASVAAAPAAAAPAPEGATRPTAQNPLPSIPTLPVLPANPGTADSPPTPAAGGAPTVASEEPGAGGEVAAAPASETPRKDLVWSDRAGGVMAVDPADVPPAAPPVVPAPAELAPARETTEPAVAP